MIEQEHNAPAIRIENLTKVYRLYKKPSDRLRDALGFSKKKKLYDTLYALNHVSFSVGRGETIGIIGTNGSGKSTLLKIITGVLNATEGEVEVDGRISALLELGAGFHQEYTGIENIYLNGTLMGFSREEIDARLEDILQFADIGDFVNQPVKTYSSGMFVRLAFAVAINIDPEILIVDEALSVGDVFFQAKCYHKFEEFKAQGRTILFVSHDLSSIAKYCDRVILLNKGNLIAQGEPKEIVDLYKQLIVRHDDGNSGEAEAVQPEEQKLQAGRLVMNPDLLEYGERQGTIRRVSVIDCHGNETDTIEKNTPFQIRMEVQFDKEVQEPIFAYTFKDRRGTEITGTNSFFEGIESGTVLPGNVVTATFSQNMTLQGGEYLLSFGCTGYHEGDFRVFHRLYDALCITVVSTKDTVGFFDMNAKVDLKKESSK